MSESTAPSRREAMLVVWLTVLGGALRSYRLGVQSLWHDEILTFLSSDGTLSHVLFQTDIQTNVLPFYYLITHAVLGWGEDEFTLRLPSVVFGTLSIPLFYFVVRQAFSTDTALWAACVLTLSPFHVYYSQEARPYALFFLLCLASWYALQRCIIDPEPVWRKAVFVVLAASTFYCHAVAIPFLMCLAWCVAVQVPAARWRQWLPTGVALALLLAPAVYRAWSIQVSGRVGWRFDPANLPSIPWSFVAGHSLGPDLLSLHRWEKLQVLAPHLWYVVPVLCVLAVVGWRGARSVLQEDPRTLLIWGAWLILPTAFMVAAAIATSRPFYVRYVMPSFAPAMVLVIVGLQQVRMWPARVVCAGLLVVVCGVSLGNYYFDPAYFRADNRGAAAYVAQHTAGDDIVLCVPAYVTTNLFHYLPDALHDRVRPFRTMDPVVTTERLPTETQAMLAGRERFWVLYRRAQQEWLKGPLERHLDRHYTRVQEFRSSGVRLVLYGRSLAAAG